MATTLEGMLGSHYTAPAAASNKSGTSATGNAGGTGTGGLSINDFYKLLATQMRYQDADNPMDTSEMMAQMVQTQMVEAITTMTQTNTITYASSMVGKEVSMAEIDEMGMFTDEVTKGTITGMLMGDNPILFIGEKGYYMSQIMTIGEVPEKPADDENGDDSEDKVEHYGQEV